MGKMPFLNFKAASDNARLLLDL